MLSKLFRNRIFRAPLRVVDNPVFVVAGVRTGSTYLTHLLNCHPNLVLGVEDRLPRLLLDILAIVDTPPGSVRYRELSTDPEKLQQIGHEGILGFHEQPDLVHAFRGLFETMFKELVKDFYRGPRAMALQQQLGIDKTGAGRWGDKLGTFWPGELLEVYFPESQYVHIIRDGRDVVVSMRSFAKKRPAAPWGRFSFEQLCSAWVETTSRLRSHGLRLGRARYHEVRYEGLLSTEQETLFGVFEFLGEEIGDPVKRLYKRLRSRLAGELFTRHGTSVSPLQSVGKWKTELSVLEQQTAMRIMGGLLEDLGYEDFRGSS